MTVYDTVSHNNKQPHEQMVTNHCLRLDLTMRDNTMKNDHYYVCQNIS
jgi:hypothetical protein